MERSDPSAITEERRRVFLGSKAPLIESAARWLLDHLGPNLADHTIVVSGARASRLLLAELVTQCDNRTLALVPPTITTPSGIPRALAVAPPNAAGELARRLAWLHALQTADTSLLRALIPSPPQPGAAGWARYAAVIQRASDDLAAHALTFADIRDRAAHDPSLGDEARWVSLAALQDSYRNWLEDRRLADPLLACARETSGPRPVVLVAVLALPALARHLIAQQDATALIHALPEEADAFTPLGLIKPSWWLEAPLPIDPEIVSFADAPRDQADAALGLVAAHAPDRHTDEVTLGVCDPALTPFIERIAQRAGHVAIRSPVGETVQRTSPYRLLALVRDCLRDRSFASLAALVRHPDAERAMLARARASDRPTASWLDTLDRYAERHLPTSLDDPWRATGTSTTETLQAIRSSLHEFLADLADSRNATPRVLAEQLLAVLERAYADTELDPDDPSQARTLGGIDSLVQAISELDRLTDARPITEALAPADAIDHLLAITRNQPLPAPPQRNAIEALGWLELLADPAPFLVLVGLNEGAVPTSARDDPILTDRVRAALDMETDNDRLARDAAILRSLIDSRESLRIIVGNRSPAGDPLAPSRLLFRAGPDQTLAIASRWIKPESTPRAGLQPRALPGQVSAFRPAPVREFDQPETLAISSLKTYLRSPYLFYLKHLLALRPRADRARELDPGAFGNLIHDTLAAFSHSPQRDLTAPEAINEHLQDTLSTLARARLAGELSPTLRIQLRFARQTLERFALWQAKRVRAGWRILKAEWPTRNDPEHAGVAFHAGDQPVLLTGRIDRIDTHAESNQLAILDYKTAATSRDPKTEHRARDGVWRDLQLPLYRHLAQSLLAGDLPHLAYIALDAKSRDVRLRPLDLNADDFDSADDCAREIIRGIRAREIEALERIEKNTLDDVLAWIAGLDIEDRSEGDA